MPKKKISIKAGYAINSFADSLNNIKNPFTLNHFSSKKLFLFFCLFLCFQFLGCSGNEEPECLPKDAILPQIRKRIKVTKRDGKLAPQTVSIYFDGSGSMRGFVPKGNNRTGYAYCNFIRFLGENRFFPEAETNFKAFGACIRDLSITKELYPMVGLVNSGCRHRWYQQKELICPKSKKPFNSISRLDLVLEEIRQAPESNLSIVVTDLFLSHEQAVANVIPTVDLLRQIMHNRQGVNKAVGIIGVKSKFKGKIDDLPGRDVYFLDGYLPFYILIFGESASVRQIVQSVEKEKANLLLEENSEKMKTAFFSSSPSMEPITLKKLQKNHLITVKGFERTAYLTKCKGESQLGPHQQFNCYCNRDNNSIYFHLSNKVFNYGVDIKTISNFYITWWKYLPNKSDDCKDKWQKCGGKIKNPPIKISLDFKNYNDWNIHLKGPSKKVKSTHDLYYGEIVLKAREVDSLNSEWLSIWNYNLGSNPAITKEFHPTPHLKSLYKIMKISMNHNLKNSELTCLGIVVDLK